MLTRFRLSIIGLVLTICVASISYKLEQLTRENFELSIITTFAAWLLIAIYTLILVLYDQKKETENRLRAIDNHIKEYQKVAPFDSMERVKRIDLGKIDQNQNSISNLLGSFYDILMQEGAKRIQDKYILVIRFILFNYEINKLNEKIRDSVSRTSFVFDNPDSIDITKTLYSLEEIKKLDAISYPSLTFWKGASGKSFLEKNRESIVKNSMSINRYFIMNNTNSKKEAEELVQTLKIHFNFKKSLKKRSKKYNIYLVKKFEEEEIRYYLNGSKELNFSKVPGKDQMQAVPDASLISDNIVSVWNFNNDGKTLNQVKLIIKKSTVESVKKLFKFFNMTRIVPPEDIDPEGLLGLY